MLPRTENKSLLYQRAKRQVSTIIVEVNLNTSELLMSKQLAIISHGETVLPLLNGDAITITKLAKNIWNSLTSFNNSRD